MFSFASQFKPVLPWTRIFSAASHSTPQVKPKPPLGLVSAQRRFRKSDHARPFLARRLVVVRFGVMDVAADARALAVGVIEIPCDVFSGIILEQFGIGPLHSAFGQQIFRGFPRTAEAFEQKNGFGKFFLHSRNDVLPRGHGNFVAGVAAETVHAAPAPDNQRVGDDVPEFHIVLFEFDQIFPNRAPRARAGKFAVGFFQEKLRAGFPATSNPSRCG